MSSYEEQDHRIVAYARDLQKAEAKIAELEQSIKTIVKEDGVVVSRQREQIKALEEFEDDVRDIIDCMERSEFYQPLNDALARLMKKRSTLGT